MADSVVCGYCWDPCLTVWPLAICVAPGCHWDLWLLVVVGLEVLPWLGLVGRAAALGWAPLPAVLASSCPHCPEIATLCFQKCPFPLLGFPSRDAAALKLVTSAFT